MNGNETRHRTVPWLELLRIDMSMLWRGRRRDIIVFFLLALFVMAIAAYDMKILAFRGDSGDGGVRFETEWMGESDFGLLPLPGILSIIVGYIVVCWTGFLWPFSVWRNELPKQRGYFWALAADRTQHALARVAAGGALLLIGSAIMVALFAVGLTASGRGAALTAIPVIGWANFVTAPLTIYLLVSIAALRSNHPGRLAIFTVIGVNILYVLFNLIGFYPGAAALGAVTEGPFSYPIALSEPLFVEVVPILPEGDSYGLWPALLWLTLSIVGVYLGARKHQET